MALSSMSPGAILLTCLAVTVALAVALKKRQHDPREPPLVTEPIPYLSHICGLLQHGLRYFDFISGQHRHSVFTLEILGRKNYIVTSPELVQAIQRNGNSFAFYPAMKTVFRKLMGIDDEGIEIIFKDAHTEEGLFSELHSIQKESLLPGTDSLEQLCLLTREKLMGEVNNLPAGQFVDLYAWTQDTVMRCSMAAFFGEQDPFALDPALAAAYWAWEANVKILILGIPRFLNPKSHRIAKIAHQKCIDAFIAYLNNRGVESASCFIRNIVNLGLDRGLSTENNARSLIGLIIGIAGNTIPTVFWLLVYIYAQPDVLREVRQELEGVVDSTQEDEISLNVTLVRQKCPVFISTYKEVLRTTAGTATIRETVEDTPLDDQWLLKKGAQVQMPTAFIHSDANTWGPNAGEFDHKRFLNTQHLPREQRSKRTAAFRPFGGGNALCPGQHFASFEILLFVGSMVLGFDMLPMTTEFEVPEMDRSKFPINSLKPIGDVRVRLCRRAGWEGKVFK